MKFLDISIMAHLSKALLVMPTIRESWTDTSGVLRVREPYIYEHVFGPLVWMSILRATILLASTKWSLFATKESLLLWVSWAIVVFGHVVVKEIISDPLIAKKPFNWPNVIERVFGCLLGLVVLL